MTRALTCGMASAVLLLTGCTDAGDTKQSDVPRPAAVAPIPVKESPSPASTVTDGRTVSSPAASGGRSARASGDARHEVRSGGASSPIPPRAPRRVTLGDIDFTGVGYDRGDPRAPVVVIDLSDFGCPYCGEFARETYPVIEREYVRTGKVYFKYVPFIAGSFPHAREATRGAECAAEQGKFWEMFDRIYQTQAEWRRGSAVDAQMAALAGTIPVDTARFGACYRDGRTDARTARATEVANRIGVRVTPSFVVDGRPVQGALPIAEFRKVIDAALLVRQARRAR